MQIFLLVHPLCFKNLQSYFLFHTYTSPIFFVIVLRFLQYLFPLRTIFIVTGTVYIKIPGKCIVCENLIPKT